MQARAEALKDSHRREVLAGDHLKTAKLSLLLLLDEIHQLGIRVPQVLVKDLGSSGHVLGSGNGIINTKLELRLNAPVNANEMILLLFDFHTESSERIGNVLNHPVPLST